MRPDEEITRDHPLYQERLEAQHGLLLALAALPVGVGAGLFLAIPVAMAQEGLTLGIMSTGVGSVLFFLGIGLLAYALWQGLPGLVRGFWTLRHALSELSGDQRITWTSAMVGLGTVGAAAGWLLAFLVF